MYCGKENFIRVLMNREGYSDAKASVVVDAVIQVIKEQLIKGKNVQIEGLGTLTIVTRTPRRAMEKNLKQGPTILTKYKQTKSVKLTKTVKMKALDNVT